jgi:hypothetical protein
MRRFLQSLGGWMAELVIGYNNRLDEYYGRKRKWGEEV